MVTFGDSESFLGDGPMPEEADGWSTSRISWLVVVSILRGSFNLSSLVVDLEREDIREKGIFGYCCMKYVWLIAKNKAKDIPPNHLLVEPRGTITVMEVKLHYFHGCGSTMVVAVKNQV